MRPKYAFAQGVIFFAIGFVTVIALEAILLAAIGVMFNSRIVPRGIAWLVIPVLGGVAGWALGKNIGIEGLLNAAVTKLNTTEKPFRVWVAGTLLWSLVICGTFSIFAPLDRYEGYDWRGGEWMRFLGILFGPPVIGFV